MNFSEVIDYTALSEYMKCPRAFYFRHIRNWSPDMGINLDLLFGLALHAGMEAGLNYLKNNPDATESILSDLGHHAFMERWAKEGGLELDAEACFPKSPMRGVELINESWRRYLKEDSKKEILGAEIPFQIDLGPGLPSFIGRLDWAMRNGKEIEILEHKTTKSFSSVWYAGFDNSLQVEGYLTAASLFYDGTPKVIINGFLAQKTQVDVTRYTITRRQQALERYLSDLRFYVSEIMEQEKKLLELRKDFSDPSRDSILTLFPRRVGLSCTAWMRRCPYMELCLARNNPETWHDVPPGFKFDEWDPRNHHKDATPE